jgi:hypothetical protein
MKYLGKPTRKGDAAAYREVILETAELIDGWLEGVVVNGEMRMLAPNRSHLENLTRLLRESAGK